MAFDDSGRYSVEVSNLAGAARSESATLQVIIPPTIITPPTPQTVLQGENVSLSVAPNGTTPLHFEWLFNGTKIPGAESRTLFLQNVTRERGGSYSVRISNLAGDVTSDAVTLTVLVPPSIGEQPQGQTVRAGERISLHVRVNGDGPFSYQWRLNGVNIPGETSDTLVRDNVRPEDSGSYTVVVRSPSGTTTSDPALIVVLVEETVFGDNFEDRVVLPGPFGSLKGSSTLATAQPGEPFHANRRPARSVWARWVAPGDGIASFNTTGSSFDTVLAVYLGNSVSSLASIASDEDGGGFLTSAVRFNVSGGAEYAIAVDGVGGVGGTVVLSWSFQATIVRVPRITSTPRDQTVLAGGTATFTVTAVDDGGAPLTYQWFKDGVLMPGRNDRVLNLSNVGELDVARYQVEVSNGQAAVRSAPAKLVIGVNEAGGAATGVSPEDKFADATPGGGGSGGAAAGVNRGNHRAGFVLPGGFEAQRLIKAGTAVARGYSGSQVFNSFGSTTEANEPNHCGVIGGASQWFTYQAEADGSLLVSTGGSEFDTVLAVYTGSGADFESLTLVACDDNSGPNGATSLVRFTATAGTVYYIAVDGIGGAAGRVKLSYALDVPLRLLSSAGFSGGPGEAFGLTMAAQQSGAYTLQASTNMLDWFSVATTNLVVPRGGTVAASLRDTNSVSDVFRFYRAVFVPAP
ncbi:MAG: hypothetical protein FJ404_14085 [Verrucomicrobia bacterium]|nr:hypothetical protein [Verrucomicrobiota bacterium]